MEENKDAKIKKLLEKFLADKSIKLLHKENSRGDKRYTFLTWEKETPEERRVQIVDFTIYSTGEAYMHRSTGKYQKFLCINGPRAGERVTEEDAPDYIAFNRAVFCRGSRNKSVPKVVLIYRASLAAAKRSR